MVTHLFGNNKNNRYKLFSVYIVALPVHVPARIWRRPRRHCCCCCCNKPSLAGFLENSIQPAIELTFSFRLSDSLASSPCQVRNVYVEFSYLHHAFIPNKTSNIMLIFLFIHSDYNLDLGSPIVVIYFAV